MVWWVFVLSAISVVGNFQDRTIIQFGSSNCLACKQLQPAVDQLVAEGWVIRYVDTDQDRSMADRLRVRQIPTMIVFERSREVDRIVGANSYEDLKNRLTGQAKGVTASSTIPSPSAPNQSIPNQPIQSQPAQGMVQLRSGSQNGVVAAGAFMQADSTNSSVSSAEFVSNPSRSVGSEPFANNGVSTRGSAVPNAEPMGATVRIRVDDQRTESVGTGTIIDTHGEEALVLTCGHMFRDSKGRAPVTVELFQDGRTIRLPATVVDYRADDVDMGLLSFRRPGPVSVVRLLPKGARIQERDPVFSIGCDRGADPTRRDTNISKLNRYLGPTNIEIAGAPVQGRSGGGLFDAQGRLIGVCYAADNELNEGLYSGPDVVYAQLERLGLKRLYDPQAHSGNGFPLVSGANQITSMPTR